MGWIYEIIGPQIKCWVIEQNDIKSRITKLSRHRFSKPFVLIKSRVLKYRPGLNIVHRTMITQNPGSIFQIYTKVQKGSKGPLKGKKCQKCQCMKVEKRFSVTKCTRSELSATKEASGGLKMK